MNTTALSIDRIALWQWVPAAEFRRPAPPMPHRFNRLVARRLVSPQSAAPSTAEAASAVGSEIAAEVAASLGWHLAPWIDDPARQPSVRLVILPPPLGVEVVMRRLARSVGWPLLAPPSQEDILGTGGAWRSQLAKLGSGPLVMPALHRTFLRHADGLDRLRELLAHLSRPGVQALVGCDSWAWQYLHRIMHLQAAFTAPVTVQAFHADRLATWLPQTLGVLTDSVAELAAEANGNPAVATAIGRLAAEHEATHQPAHRPAPTGAAWLRAYLPQWPADAGKFDTLVVWSMLIHGGLTADALGLTMLITPDELRGCLHRLSAAGIIALRDGVMSVTAAGLPAVRAHLVGQGYPVAEA